MKETKIEKLEILICPVCKERLFYCDSCNAEFKFGQEIQCYGFEHYHKECPIDIEG